jgi:hypothetical protein
MYPNIVIVRFPPVDKNNTKTQEILRWEQY